MRWRREGASHSSHFPKNACEMRQNEANFPCDISTWQIKGNAQKTAETAAQNEANLHGFFTILVSGPRLGWSAPPQVDRPAMHARVDKVSRRARVPLRHLATAPWRTPGMDQPGPCEVCPRTVELPTGAAAAGRGLPGLPGCCSPGIPVTHILYFGCNALVLISRVHPGRGLLWKILRKEEA